MFRFRTLRKNSSSDNYSREDSSSRAHDEIGRASSNIISDQDSGVDDPLLRRLNHQRRLNEEEKSRKISKNGQDFEPEVFIGWGHAEKDPFDLDSKSSDEEDQCRHTKNVYQKENQGDFLGWGAGSFTSLDELEHEKTHVTQSSIGSGLSPTSSSRILTQQRCPDEGLCLASSSSQNLSEPNKVDDPNQFIKRNDNERRLSSDYNHQNLSVIVDAQSTHNEVPSPKSSVVRGMMTRVKSHSNIVLCSLDQYDETLKPPLQSSMLDQSSHRSQGKLPPAKRLNRRPTFMNMLSGSLGMGVPDAGNLVSAPIKVVGSDAQPQSQTMQQSCIIVQRREEEEESPRLQQLKEQTVEDLHNEMSKMQVQAQNNLERSWAEAERIRRSNDELDEMISSLKVKLAEAKAAPTTEANEGASPAQDSFAVASTSIITQQTEKGPPRSFSSAALTMLLGNNNDFYDENTQTVLTKIKSDPPLKRKSKARRRKTFISELSSGFGIGALRANNAIDISHSSRGSDVGMSIDGHDERSESTMSQASGYLNQCYDDIDSGSFHPSRYNDDNKSKMVDKHGTSDYDYFLSPDDAADERQKTRTAYESVAEQEKLGDMRSAIESAYSGASYLQLEEHNIFHVEASLLIMEDLNDQLTKITEELVQIEEAVQKQEYDIKACYVDIDRVKSNEEVKKLQELESTAVLDLEDFNRCFRSLEGKLQSIESIGFNIKTTLDENKSTYSFEEICLHENRLLQAKDLVHHDSERLYLLEILNDALSFRQYCEARERVMANILRIEFLEADLWNQLVNIRLCIEQEGDEEGTQTTESSMASERRALERVFIESILPHVEFAQLTKINALRYMEENVKVLQWWNHLINCMECSKTCDDVTSCVDFITKEPSLSLQNDVSLLERVIHVTSENLDNIKFDVKQECKSFRCKVERAGLLFNSSSKEMSLDDNKLIAKSERTPQQSNLQSNVANKMIERRKVLSEKDKTLKQHAAQLKTVYANAEQEIEVQLHMLEKMHNHVQMFTSKMLEQDSLLSSLKKRHARKQKKVISLKKIVEGSSVDDRKVSY
ncbi:hypothetical protein ACHAWX_006860 [Stephanocyclus meneghinianus]